MSYTFNKGSLFAKVDGELKDINVLVGNDVTEERKAAWDAKQDAISDLESIRHGAAMGATAIQNHQSLAGYATKEYVDSTYSNIQSLSEKDVGDIING